MIIVTVPESKSNIIVVKLTHLNVKVDPRIISFRTNLECSLSVNGTTLTITRIDEDGPCCFYLRAYLPTEPIPDFTSTVYTYLGVDDERVPRDTTKVIFHPSVTTIKGYAFRDCVCLERVSIPDHVTTMEYGAFQYCFYLIFIKLSMNLVCIGDAAFQGCASFHWKKSTFRQPSKPLVVMPSMAADT